MDNTTVLSITPPTPFDFVSTASSHGWVVLAPNSWYPERGMLRRVHRLDNGKVVLLEITGEGSPEQARIEIRVDHDMELSTEDQDEIRQTVSRMFRLNEDLSEFYARCAAQGGHWLRITNGMGRVLASPSVFEDAVKTISTTNVQWGGTKGMITRLVNTYGDPYPANPALKAFPTPQAIAAAPFDAFAGAVRMGYRSEYVYSLAQRVASGELDLEAWREAAITTAELRKRLLGIKGVGNYAAATLLMLLGHYDELPVDTAFRSLVTRKYFNGQPVSDKEAQAVYQDWGRWKYLAYWFDIYEEYS